VTGSGQRVPYRRVAALLTEHQHAWSGEIIEAMRGLNCTRSHIVRLALDQFRDRHSSAKNVEAALRAQIWRELEISRAGAADGYVRVPILLTEQQYEWAERLIAALKGLQCSISHVIRLALDELRARHSSAKGFEATLRSQVWRELEGHPELEPKRRPATIAPNRRLSAAAAPSAVPHGGEVIRVLIVDDHELVRAGLRATLTGAGFDVAADVSEAQGAIRLVELHSPDVVLIDPSIEGAVGAIGQITAIHPTVKVIAFTTFPHRARILAAVEAGAVGFLFKDADSEEVARGVRAAAKGEATIAFRTAVALLGDGARRTPLSSLTARERQVLILVCRGLVNKQIGRRLGISEKTVKAHLGKAFQRIGVSDRTQAALWAERNGLLADSPVGPTTNV
jgi:DNA-binding NarL/FixJ family response regulator/Arc/MetJ-type ribon-helix-helix transcriptional regulator